MENIDYKKLCEEYEQRMGIGRSDPAKKGYLVLVKLLNQHNEYLDNISVKTMIAGDDKKPEYDRAKALWEKLPDMIREVSSLRAELKMDGENTTELVKPISAKSIADGANVL